MSCMLRISGEFLDVDSMVFGCGIVPNRTWRKNEERTRKGTLHANSGANFVVSDADFDDFSGQVEEAINFLEEHAVSVAKMTAHPGVQVAVLDFGTSLSAGQFMKSCHLPLRLVQLAASANLALEISQYACGEGGEIQDVTPQT